MNELQLVLGGVGQAAVVALLALGLVVVYKGSGVLNFGQGAVATFAAYGFVWLYSVGVPIWVSAVIAVLAAVGVGALFSWAVVQRLRNASPLASVVATLGLLALLRGFVDAVFGTISLDRPSFLPGGVWTLPFGEPPLIVGRDRAVLLVVGLVLAVALAALYRYTRFGLRTRALADNSVAVSVTGHAPNRLSAANWALGSGLAGIAGVLLVPLASMTPDFYTSLMFTAIAAALLGRFSSFGLTFVAALVLGVLQPVFVAHAADLKALTGLGGWGEALPLLVIAVYLTIRGRGLPNRDLLVARPLDPVARPRHPVLLGGVAVLIGVVLCVVAPSGLVRAMSTGLIFTVLALSLVVLIGFVGQVSLAQVAFAGVGAFATSYLTIDLPVPFPLTIVLAGLVAVPFGLVVGIPALRVRGINLAIVTLGAAIALERMVFADPDISGGAVGREVGTATIGGQAFGGLEAPRWFAGLAVLVVALVGAGVVILRRSSLGQRLLAVRANERGTAAAGISVARTKLLGFAIAAFIAGVAGALLAYQNERVVSLSFTSFDSILLVSVAFVGGIGAVAGAVIAGVMAPSGLLEYATSGFLTSGWIGVLTGFGVMATVVQYPSGVAGMFARRRPTRASPPATEPEPRPSVVEGAR